MYHPRLKGTHYDMGFHYGKLMFDKGITLNDSINLTKEEKEFGIASYAVLEQYLPNICQEIKGLAEGQQMDFLTLASWLLCMYGFGDIHGCTCFCVNCDGKTYLARNSDMFTSLKKTCESILYQPVVEKSNGVAYRFLGNSTSLIQMEDGINEFCLAVGINFLLTKEYKIGLNTGFVVRGILEMCKTTTEAVEFIKSVPLSTTQNFIIADKNGDMVVVEASPNKIVIRKPTMTDNNYSFIISTNEFIDSSMQNEHNNPSFNWYHSHERYETILNVLSKSRSCDFDLCKNILGDKFGFVSNYEKELNFSTLWSSIYETTSKTILRSEINPMKISYQKDERLKK